MAKPRRTFTDEDKAKVVAYCAEHGQKVTAEHFNIATSMVNRWRNQARGNTGRKLKWTPEKIAEVLEYFKTHRTRETLHRFKISGAQLYLWKKGLSQSHYSKPRSARKGNGAHPVTNGLGELPERDALVWVQRWRDAYFAQLKAETPSAQSVLKALRGGK